MSDLIKDLRENLNRAQDNGQEALKNIERAKTVGTLGSFFDDQTYHFAREAAHHAQIFAELCQQAAKLYNDWLPR